MSYRTKKDLSSENFIQCNSLLGKQVTEVSKARQGLFRCMSTENNTEFSDETVYSTYSDIYDVFVKMYSANVDNEITIGKRKALLYANDNGGSLELETIIENVKNHCKDLEYKFGDLQSAGGTTSATFAESIAMVWLKENLTREEYERYQVLLAKAKAGDPVLALDESLGEKTEFIALYEKLYPTDAENMDHLDKIFSKDGYTGYEEDLLNIKVLTYSADDPYKSIFIDNISSVKKGDLHYAGWSQASGGKFYINVDDMYTINPVTNVKEKTGTAYNTFFHEVSHCIDYKLGEGFKSFTSEYEDSVSGLTLNDALENDVRLRIQEYTNIYFLNNPGITPDEQKAIQAYVEDAIMNQVDKLKYGEPDFSVIVGSDPVVGPVDVKDCYDDVVSSINSQVTGFACDNYGGLTGNTLKGSGGYHEALMRNDGKYRVYWISGDIGSNGKHLYIKLDDGKKYKETIDFRDSTQWSSSSLDERVIMSDGEVIYDDNIASEFFANGMAANISRDTDDLKAYGFYYSDTIDYFENMLNTLN
ncbi:MAG: hypothetical protein IJO70_11990 [Lachnospiraceae bacterium]|nr:hypothetical protein [Lachnospiraceae bacterium]